MDTQPGIVEQQEIIKEKQIEQELYTASQWKLMWIQFRRHKLAMIGVIILTILYVTAIFAPFFSPNNPAEFYDQYNNAPPSKIHFMDEGGFSLRPFFYKYSTKRDPINLSKIYTEDQSERFYLYLFVRGSEYKMFNMFTTNIHLFGTDTNEPIFLFGTDKLGRDLFSRNLHASRISLSIGLVGVAITFLLGCLIGGISGYYGGIVDNIIQRSIEFLLAIPTLPLWLALSAALPREWSQIKVYLMITVILAIAGWTGLARIVRGKLISTRNEEFVMAAKLSGASDLNIIVRHLLPGFFGYLIVHLSISIPVMILGETALSFLGLGLRAPVISWGVLLNDAQNINTLALYPWILIPGIFVVIVVLAFNFVGDGLRDAADPYKEV